MISNVVREELAQAPDAVRKAILAEVRDIELELILESDESRSLFVAYEALSVIPDP